MYAFIHAQYAGHFNRDGPHAVHGCRRCCLDYIDNTRKHTAMIVFVATYFYFY